MKKLITTVVALAATFTLSFGQAIPNAGFENWTNSGTYEEPDGWSTGNIFTFLSDSIPVTVEKTTDSHSGTYAAKLTTLAAGGAGLDQIIGLPYDTMPGILAGGSFVSGQLGFPRTTLATTANMYAKYTKVGTDTAIVVFSLSKWNANTQQQDIVGQAAGFIINNIVDYQQVSLPFNYISNLTPDTVNITILSSLANLIIPGSTHEPFPGTTMYVDDITLTDSIPNAVQEFNSDIMFKMYPNPTSGTLNLLCVGYNFSHGALTMDIIDMTGRTVQVHTFNTVQSSTDVSSLASGLYVYRIKDAKGVVKAGKFNVAK